MSEIERNGLRQRRRSRSGLQRSARYSCNIQLVLAFIFILTLPTLVVNATPAIGASGDDAAHGSHGWVVIREAESRSRLVHLPPAGSAFAEPGRINPLIKLAAQPRAVGAIGDRVVLVFEGTDERRVLSARIAPAIGGVWALASPDRLDAWAALPGDGALLGVGSAGESIVVCMRTDAGLMILRGQGEQWRQVNAPGGLDPGGRVRVLDLESHITLLDTTSEPPVVWSACIYDSKDQRGEIEWSSTPMASAPGLDLAEAVFAQRGAVVWLGRDESNSLIARRSDAQATFRIHDFGPLGDDYAAVLQPGGGGVLTVLVRDAGVQANPDALGPYRIVAVSAATGVVLHDGPPDQPMPVSRGELQMIAGVLVLLTGVVLFIALRPGPEPDAVVLPENTALAEPGQRLVAMLIDVVLALVVTSRLFDVPLLDLATGAVLVMPGGPWEALPATLLVGAAIGSVCEALFARSPGKLLTGCRVVSDRGGRLGAGRCVLRNLIKWLLPPIAMMALLDPSGRHRGDSAARAAIITDLEPDQNSSSPGGPGSD